MMDENQRQLLLRAIAISAAASPALMPMITPQSREESFRTLEDFKSYPDRIPVTITLLQTESHTLQVSGTSIDITASTKIYGLGILETFFKTGYIKLSGEQDRMAIRNTLLITARQLVQQQTQHYLNAASNNNNNNNIASIMSTIDSEGRILAMKIAALIAELSIREFPQRWPTFITDLMAPQGGLWCVDPTLRQNQNPISDGYGPLIGIKLTLECLKQITEDCTDSDFNAKICTSRRNDVLIGLNEIHGQFLPQFFNLLSEQFSILSEAKNTIVEMCKYLVGQGRNVHSMSEEERIMYTAQIKRRDCAGRLITDCLATLEKFCQSMPIDWIMGKESKESEIDFVAALLHFLREDVADIQVFAIKCLEQLSTRKLDFSQWMRLISHLPQAISEANDMAAQQQSLKAASEGKAMDQNALLIDQLPFHRGLSKMLAHLISAHLAHITTEKDIVNNRNSEKFRAISNYLNLMAEMLAHPSGRVCGEQIVTWIGLMRDPAIAKCKTKLLSPYMERVLLAYIVHIIRIRWNDVEEQNHPLSDLLDASWDDSEEYDSWVSDLRSKATQIFKYIGNIDPKLSASIISNRIQQLLNTYGNGDPRDCLDPATNSLTQVSTAVVQIEGAALPLDAILRGMPSWALDDTKQSDASHMEPHRVETRAATRAALSQLANAIVNWDPAELWLKFRKANLLDALKCYWLHDPTTLPAGVDALLVYLNANDGTESNGRYSENVTSLRKKSGVALISVAKKVPHLLVQWLSQLSERAKTLLSAESLLPVNRMHLFEFLSCVVTAVEDPTTRSNFISDVLSNAMAVLESEMVKTSVTSAEGIMNLFGISQVANNPSFATNPESVKATTSNYVQFFSAFNQLLSVGKRCHDAARKRPNGGIPFLQNNSNTPVLSGQQSFPDEGPVSISDLSINDPFVHLWPKILPSLIQTLDSVFRLWHPSYQAKLLAHPIQRYAYAISDDEVYLVKKVDNCSVFGKGGTAGSVVSGWSRRDLNLAPKWSGWFNELRNTGFQLLGLLAMQRVLYAPEIASLYPQLVSVLADTINLQAMENRHFTQYLKQFIEILMLSCPVTLYQSHLSPILGPIFEHLQYRLEKNWRPILNNENLELTKPLITSTCDAAAIIASRGGEEWFVPYYARAGLFVGDVDVITAEAAVEKARVELSRSFSDMLQATLALKGDWALVLANQAKEEKGDQTTGPKTRFNTGNGPLNANGTPRVKNQDAIDARKHLRIDRICHFLLLEDERIAGFLVLSLVQSLEYPDTYTSRRVTKLCHRVLETVAWVDRYTNLLGDRMFSIAIKSIVTEPKWMVGVEWDVINLTRDIFCRIVLGQALMFGGQGPGMQQIRDVSNPGQFEQCKFVDKPLQGGGVLCNPSDLPKQILANLPGIGVDQVNNLTENMTQNYSAKSQKDALRDLLRIAADNVKETEGGLNSTGMWSRAAESESLLNQNTRSVAVPALPEKLITQTMVTKAMTPNEEPPPGLGDFFKLN